MLRVFAGEMVIRLGRSRLSASTAVESAGGSGADVLERTGEDAPDGFGVRHGESEAGAGMFSEGVGGEGVKGETEQEKGKDGKALEGDGGKEEREEGGELTENVEGKERGGIRGEGEGGRDDKDETGEAGDGRAVVTNNDGELDSDIVAGLIVKA